MRTDAELISSVLDGDTAAYADLVGRHERSVRVAAWLALRDRHLAEDAAQDAFVAAFESLRSLRDPRAFGPWVATIARRTAFQLRSTVPLPLTADVPADPHPDPGETLMRAVMNLPDHERQVILMHHFDQHPTPDIAALTGRPLGTITKQLSRAYARLRDKLKGVRP